VSRLTRRSMIGYGFGAAGSAGFGTVPGLLLAIYLTNTLGVAAGLASLVVLIPKLWDIIFLPFVGTLSDGYVTRRGNRGRYLIYGSLSMLICFPLMFAVPEGTNSSVAAVWVLVTFLAAASAFGFFQVPYVALAAEITDSPRERTTLMSWRVGLQMFGILIFGIGAPLLVNAVPEANTGYLLMGLAVGSLVALGMFGCWMSVRNLRRYVTESTGVSHSPVKQFAAAWQARQFRILFSAFILQALAAGAALAAAPYFSQNVLGIQNFGIVFGILLAPAVLVMPLWAFIGHRIGKRQGYLISSMLFIVGMVCSSSAHFVPLSLALAFIMLTSIGYAGMQMFPLALLPDTIDADAKETGVQRAGSFTGVWTAGETAGFAIGPALVLLLLAVTGFISSTSGQSVVQPASAVMGVTLSFSLLPAILVALSLPLVFRYSPSQGTNV
jgi:GPH family glycoside/pentoside/hexuronide:cation symporter